MDTTAQAQRLFDKYIRVTKGVLGEAEKADNIVPTRNDEVIARVIVQPLGVYFG